MKENYLKILLLALVVVVAIQGYYLYDLNRSVKEKPVAITSGVSFAVPKIRPFSGFFDDKVDPFVEMERLRREMENNFRDFDNFFQTTPTFGQFSSRLHRIPRFDMKEKDGKYIITMEVPGADKSAIDTKVENGRLVVSANVSQEKDDNTTTYYRHERHTSSFKRDILLPDDADEKSLRSEHENGLLIITIDKKRP